MWTEFFCFLIVPIVGSCGYDKEISCFVVGSNVLVMRVIGSLERLAEWYCAEWYCVEWYCAEWYRICMQYSEVYGVRNFPFHNC